MTPLLHLACDRRFWLLLSWVMPVGLLVRYCDGLDTASAIGGVQVILLPPLVCLLQAAFSPSVRGWKSAAVAAMLTLAVAIPIHVVLMLLPGLGTVHSLGSDKDASFPFLWLFLAALAEEWTKLLPLLLLVLAFKRVRDAEDALPAAFASGLAFSCFETIVTSGGYEFEGGGFGCGAALLLERCLWYAVLHASWTSIAAWLVFRPPSTGRRLLFLLPGLSIAAILHAAHNGLPPFRLAVAFVTVALLAVALRVRDGKPLDSPTSAAGRPLTVGPDTAS